MMTLSPNGRGYAEFQNNIYGDAKSMLVAAPIAIAGIPRQQFEKGSFEMRVVPHRGLWPILTSARGNPVNVFDLYPRAVQLQRQSLGAQANTLAVAPDEPHNIPKTKLELIDEVYRKLFYSQPPIPFTLDVQSTSSPDHDFKCDWDLDPAGKPIKLLLTVYCPASEKAAELDDN